jgi:hypothetical protein
LDHELHDLLGLGELTAWGRQNNGSPPRKIAPDEWQEIAMRFDERALTSTPPNICAWRRDPKNRTGGSIAYVHVMFSRKQLLDRFPLLPTPFVIPTNSTVSRIPFLEFRRMAKYAYKWDVSGNTNLEVFDLLDGVRQAGIDGAIKLWGRRNPYGEKEASVTEPLILIPADHWHDYQFETGSVVNSSDNSAVATYDFKRGTLRDGFLDIHIHESDAIRWMNRTAEEHRGRRDLRRKNRTQCADPMSSAEVRPYTASDETQPLGGVNEPVLEFANLTPRQLLALYDGRTSLQADKLMQSFKGLWVEGEGVILDVLPDGRPKHSIAIVKSGSDTIECQFGPFWASHLNRFDKGDLLKFRGKISASQNGSQLYLLDCEVIPMMRDGPDEKAVKQIGGYGNVYVTSYNQSGGITANTVNVNRPLQRKLGDDIKSKLIQNVPKDKQTIIWATHGSEESFIFASEMFEFMKKEGFNLFGTAPTNQIFLKPLYGVMVQPDEKKTDSTWDLLAKMNGKKPWQVDELC